jgi:hypothetical protein
MKKSAVVLAICAIICSLLIGAYAKKSSAKNSPTKSKCSPLFGCPEDYKDVPRAVPTARDLTNLPETFDWRDYNALPPARDQGAGCGSCWAHAPLGLLESVYLISSEADDVDLSEQHLVSCNTFGYDCEHPGNIRAVIKHLMCEGEEGAMPDYYDQTGGVWESDFPYQGESLPCTGGPFDRPICLAEWGLVGDQFGIPPVAAIQWAMQQYGPIMVGVYSNDAFRNYQGGVFDGCEDSALNHAVLLVGWNNEEGTWILRNSHGAEWGEGGYMRIPYECSKVGSGAVYGIYRGKRCQMGTDCQGEQSSSSTKPQTIFGAHKSRTPIGTPDENFFCAKETGDCDGFGYCTPKGQMICPEIIDPVCVCGGAPGSSMTNACWANNYGYNVDYHGVCDGSWTPPDPEE